MARSTVSNRIQRLDQITARLKADGFCLVKDLAESLGVSDRTISRDLALLREQGLPIEADRGRGGGVSINQHWGVGRLNLSYSDAVDMLIGIEVAQKMGSPLFLASLDSVRRQLLASFSPALRDRVERLKLRILVGKTASTFVQTSAQKPEAEAISNLHQAFLDRETLQIRYQREDGVVSDRKIEPHYLLLQYPVWYVLAMDHLRQGPRTFRCDRILEARSDGNSFPLQPKHVFEHIWAETGLLDLGEPG